MKKRTFNITIIYLGLIIFFTSAYSSPEKNHYFNVIPLGTSGGAFENNLSAYVVAPVDSERWITLDAGSLCGAVKTIDSCLGRYFVWIIFN